MTFTGTLLPYQPEAVDKMCDDRRILVAYDLGLGKTVLTIAAIERLMDQRQITEPGLIICLSSLKYQWASAIEKFTSGTSKALVIDGTPTKRAKQYEEAMNWWTSGVDYVIMNYEQVVNDWNFVSKLPRGFVVLDEATAIKSFRSKRARAVKRLSDSPFKFALTGTPIENGKPEELYSIMQFVNERVLGRFDIFDKTFIVRNNWGSVLRYKNLPTFHETMKDHFVRKAQTDPDVAPHLPATIHREPLEIVLDRKSANLYMKIVKDLLDELEIAMTKFGSNFNIFNHYGHEGKSRDEADEYRGKIMSKVTALKMLCSHPDLLKLSAKKHHETKDEGSEYVAHLVDNGYLDNVTDAPKFHATIRYVKDFLDQAEENKVVIFSTYVGMVEKLREALEEYGAKIYTGQLDAKTKEENKVALNTDPTVRVLVSSDAGGYGVDLPAANMLVNYDLPWTSGGAVQRNGRIKRASSKWPSIVIQDILVYNSIEMRQNDMLQQKNSVAAAVIDGQGIDKEGELLLTLESLKKFLEAKYV